MKFYLPQEVYDAWQYGYASYQEEMMAKGILLPNPPYWDELEPPVQKVYERMAKLLNRRLEEALHRDKGES